MVKIDYSQNYCKWSLGSSRVILVDLLIYCICSSTHPEAELHVLGSILMNEVWCTDGEKVSISQSQTFEVYKLFIEYFSVLQQWSGLVSNMVTRAL